MFDIKKYWLEKKFNIKKNTSTLKYAPTYDSVVYG